MNTAIVVLPVDANDLEAVLALWSRTEGISIRAADSPEALRRYLRRNPGLSLKAMDGDRIVGAVLSGHDGRRGYLHHLAVDQTYRHRGIGRDLVERCLSALRDEGIDKSHVFVLADNSAGRGFWSSAGWAERSDLVMFSHSETPDA
jgi:ribosomal protein S18 acetylase RimI-like enzyme